MNELLKSHMDIVSRCVIGMSASVTGIGLSTIHQLELWLRVSSLIVGIAVGVASLIGIVIRIRNDVGKNKRP